MGPEPAVGIVSVSIVLVLHVLFAIVRPHSASHRLFGDGLHGSLWPGVQRSIRVALYVYVRYS
jgi:hypothetical protein